MPKPGSARGALVPFVAAPLVGVAFGLSMRLLFGVESGEGGTLANNIRESNLAPVMSVSFLFVVPAVMSALTVLVASRGGVRLSIPSVLALSFATSFLTLIGAMLSLLEGSICIAMICPVFSACGFVGALSAYFFRKIRAKHDEPQQTLQPLAFVAVLPVVCGVIEARLTAPAEHRTVENRIVIHAPKHVVWENIKSVPAIDPSELDFSLSHLIGLPRPVEATLDRDGVGGVRMASFERGLVFREVVTDFNPEHTIAFTIDVAAQPPVALDDHVAVGGRYFDVFDGRYTMNDLGDDNVELVLVSTQRLSTTFNFYASLWSDFVMWDLQQAIMKVIKRRCEAEEAYASLPAHP